MDPCKCGKESVCQYKETLLLRSSENAGEDPRTKTWLDGFAQEKGWVMQIDRENVKKGPEKARRGGPAAVDLLFKTGKPPADTVPWEAPGGLPVYQDNKECTG